MASVLRIWFILAIFRTIPFGGAEVPFLQRLVQAGFDRSELNVVYFVTGASVNASLLHGDFPRVLVPRLSGGSRERKNGKLRIAAQSLVVIDGRDEPVHQKKCLTYLSRELARIHNPGSNKFVLLVDQAFTQDSSPNLKMLQEELLSYGVGYTAVLSFPGTSLDPITVTRISFRHTATSAPTALADAWDVFRFDISSLDGMPVVGMMHKSYPFCYIAYDGRWTGTDFYTWGLIAKQLRLRLELKHATPGDRWFTGGAYSPAMQNGSVHFLATRDVLMQDEHPKIHLYTRDQLSLIVPRPITRNLIDALLQPFTRELWILIGVGVSVRVVVAHLTATMRSAKRHAAGRSRRCRYREMVGQLRPSSAWIGLVWGVLTFVLIEGYLAKVTSLLLTLRYTEGPQNLEQFLAAGIPILEPFGSQYVQFHADPVLAARIRERFVRRTIAELRQSTDECYVELRSRVVQLAFGTDPIDAVTGRRNFYILEEPLAVVHLQYTFGRESAIKRVFERCLGRYEENGLRLHMEQFYERWAQQEQERKKHGINGTVLGFRDLHSLWICVVLGWCLSAVVFFAECVAQYTGSVMTSRLARWH